MRHKVSKMAYWIGLVCLFLGLYGTLLTSYSVAFRDRWNWELPLVLAFITLLFFSIGWGIRFALNGTKRLGP